MDGLPRPAEDDLYEMANLYGRTTGLPVTVWVSPRGGARHDARVKVSAVPGDRMVIEGAASVAIRPEPRLVEGTLHPEVLADVTRWIALNRDALLAYWDGALDTVELVQALRRVD